MKLTENFTLEELTRSDNAVRYGIDNTASPEIMGHLLVLAEALEKVRGLLGNRPISINSGYRCPALNARTPGSSDTSAHMSGYAADFTCAGYGTPLEIVKRLAKSDLDFDQVIQEGTWVHFSVDPKMRRQVLTAVFNAGGKTTYRMGIQEST